MLKTYSKRRLPITKFLILLAIFLPLLCGISTLFANVVSLVELGILLWFWNKDEFWVLVPVLFIFFPQLLLVGKSVSLYNVFCVVCLIKFFQEGRVAVRGNAPVFIFYFLMLYAAVVCCFCQSVWDGAVLGLQATVLIYTVLSIKKRPHIRKLFQGVFIVACINSAIYGMRYGNFIGNNDVVRSLQYNVRYSGTYADPNYMAFFYAIALCYLLFMKDIKQVYKWAGVAALGGAMAMTGSLTGLIAVFVLCILYILFNKGTSYRTKILHILLTLGAMGLFVFYITSDGISIGILETYKYRVRERWAYASQGYGMSEITSGRSSIQSRYLSFLAKQNIGRILFGGYQINTQGLHSKTVTSIEEIPHNTYMDVLMTCGLFGLVLFLMALLSNMYRYWRLWRKGEEEALTHLVYIGMSVVYIYGLSLFPSPNYMYFLML